jgi:OOP family OmpA-OmpF porin
MGGYLRYLIAAVCCAGLAACASVDYKEVGDMPSTGGAFQQALHKEYVAIAGNEAAESHFGASSRWATKGQMAAQAQSVSPESLENWTLPAGTEPDLAAARSRLMGAFDKGAAETVPGPLAHAQAMFDCWVEEQAENYQPRDIARCRSAFEDAMAQVDEALMPAPMVVEAEPAPPPPPPTPAPQPAPDIRRDYMVFFDFDESDLTVGAQTVVRAAAAATRRGRVSVIVVTGHTDRSGGASYNKALSERRAAAVREELGRQGVRVSVITESRGEADPLVATDDGVRQPQNRRASIVLQ